MRKGKSSSIRFKNNKRYKYYQSEEYKKIRDRNMKKQIDIQNELEREPLVRKRVNGKWIIIKKNSTNK